MSQTRFPAARILHQCRVAMIVAMSIAFLTECGCKTARPVRSYGKGHDRIEAAQQAGKPAEPAMAANVALKTDEASEPDRQPPTPSSSRLSTALSRIGSRFSPIEPRSKDVAAIPDVNHSDAADADGLVEVDRSDSSMERLNAALTDDVSQSNSLPQRSVTTLDARIRIDSLLSRARQLFEVGQLEQARQTALTAQELSESSQVDFFPDEDRPIDLIRRIDGELKELRVKDEPESGGESKKSQASQAGPEIQQPMTKSSKAANTSEKDSSGLARIRRDWSTLFRRDKKPNEPDANPTSPDTKLAKAPRNMESRTRDMQANHTSTSDSAPAIVMANRSVSLANSESTAIGSAPFTPDVGDQSATESGSVQSLNGVTTESQYLETSDPTDPSAAINGPRSRPGLELQDGAGVQPDVEIVDPITPFRQMKSKKQETARAETIDEAETRQSDGIYLYVIFGICTVLAFGCYRRGAT